MNNPLAPFERAPRTPLPQTLIGAGTINPLAGTIYLDQTTAPTTGTAHAVTLPDGNYERQSIQILVPSDNETTTARFRVTGTLVGGNALLFHTIAHNAVLMWDSTAWHLVGGNAELET